MRPQSSGLVGKVLTRIACGVILVYQWAISPYLAPRCRFWPSCSHYGLEALRLWGLRRGLSLTVRRVSRCHPWSAGGVDEVPQPSPGSPDSSYLAHVLRRFS